MTDQTTELTAETGVFGLLNPSRIKIDISTSAKGEINVSAEITAAAGLTPDELAEITANSQRMVDYAVTAAAKAKYRYMAELDQAAREYDAAEDARELAEAAQAQAEQLAALVADSPPAVDPAPAIAADDPTAMPYDGID